ncbi:hypothetical protein H4R33_006781 [Dimargaris cristalligena]|nr:hypothetical protein H4R33_006781 [Dimargaris cristalligena]
MLVNIAQNAEPNALHTSTSSAYVNELSNQLSEAYQRVCHKLGPKPMDPTQYHIGDYIPVQVPHGPLSLQAPFEGLISIEGIHSGNKYTITPVVHDKCLQQEQVSGDQCGEHTTFFTYFYF